MIFTVPQSKYTDFYDIARFNMIWRINIIMIIVLPLLATALHYLGEATAIPSLIGLFTCFIMVLILKFSKSYTICAIILAVIGTLLSQYTLILFPESYHFVDTMWVMIIVLITYFTLGKIWGMLSLGVSIVGIIYYIFFVLKDNIFLVKKLNNEDLIALSINFVICSLIIAYLIMQFISTSRYAENKYKILTKKLQDSNQEKTIMLKEIHHRVKNNLQVITSLLRLQSREIKDVDSKTIYQESINRVIAMALIHEKMYQTKNLAKIDLEEYINSLAHDLLASYSVQSSIAINVKSAIENISTKSLVPLALIFNELISNSIKHAFKGTSEGEITIDIVNNTNHIILEYKDNGTWQNPMNTESFGMELIDSLTEQLSGSFKRTVSKGTKYTFTFAPENQNDLFL